MMPFKRPYFFFPFLFIGAALLMAAVVMLLWNAILPDLTGWAQLTFWKALGLLVLSRILFGGFGRGRWGRGGGPKGSHGPPWRERWKSMTDEERQTMKARWRERCGPR
ncbi:MAG: hypothetical protein KBA60_03210 [Flavobacteriales bacterium]|nr:hypothetical protein [Flavobacteriales bacterium]MBP7154990.1 hypothetical protein [Flavobacteriales bacterium]HQV76639.1 hypothetical protein [Flavobacteriales bacterium]